MYDDEVNFCTRCGTEVELAERYGRVRPVCPACGWIYFHDPKVAVAALILHEDQVLLVRRANDPKRGLWTLPAGFMDAGEDPARAVERECLEETGLEVSARTLLDVISGKEHSRGANLLIVYRVEVLGGELRPADDVDRADYFQLTDLPPLAFETTTKVLSRYALRR